MYALAARPSRSVLRQPLPGRRFFLDCRWLTDAHVTLLQTHGPPAALALLDADARGRGGARYPSRHR